MESPTDIIFNDWELVEVVLVVTADTLILAKAEHDTVIANNVASNLFAFIKCNSFQLV
jgi:hypothetical protein